MKVVAALLLLMVGTALGREWVSVDGSRKFEGQLIDYRSPLVTVMRADGQKITFSEELLSGPDKDYCYLASHVIGKSYPQIPYRVRQVLSNGLLCEELPQNNRYYSGEMMFIWGDYAQVVAEGDVFRHDIYWAGSYSYVSVQNARRTVRSFTKALDEAVAVLAYRLVSPETSNKQEPAIEKEQLSSSGTGFAITENGYLVTNSHVIEGAEKVQVNVGSQKFEAKVVISDVKNDLAIIKIDAATKPLHIDFVSVKALGDEVTVGGFPNPDIQGTNIKLTRGVISGLSGIQDDIRHFQIDAAVQPGNSGGPLVSADGSVVGIVNARLNDKAVALATGALPQNVNYAIKVNHLMPLLMSEEGLVNMVLAIKPPESGKLGAMLEESTHLIVCELKPSR